MLRAAENGRIDRPVFVERSGGPNLALRLVAIRKPEKAAAEARRKARRDAQCEGYRVSNEAIEAADWVARRHRSKTQKNPHFSGGEQQRVNFARGFISNLPVLLLDEPTASRDAANRAVVVALIGEKKRAGVAMVAIVRDDEIR